MKPLDPRLLRHAGAARGYLVLTAGLGLVSAALIVAQSFLLVSALAPVVTREADLPDVVPSLGPLAAVLVLRAAVVGVQERFAHRAATRVIAELRSAVLAHSIRLGPRWLARSSGAESTTLVTRGLDGLEPYFVRYLPQLLLAATVTPLVLLVIAGQDLIAAGTLAFVLPLIPLFMILIGRLTEEYASRRLRVLQRLGAQVLDLIAGLPTLKALGRERGPGAKVRELGEAHRRATQATLRVAFLSGGVLELLATLSVALVAVGVGLRLVFGELDLATGLVVLILAPEVVNPLRQVGAHFHASADGVAAARAAFEILDVEPPAGGRGAAPDLRSSVVEWADVAVRVPGQLRFAPAGLSGSVAPGEVVALAGPNGAGKTTAALVLLGLLTPDRGVVRVRPLQGGAAPSLADLDLSTWWAQATWVPQRPAILPGTVRENVADRRAVAEQDLDSAAQVTGFAEVVADLPNGWDTRVGHGGVGLSVGQRQRLALTRAFVEERQLVVLDEPSAHLDARAEEHLLRSIRALADAGRSVVVVAHRATLLDVADRVLQVDGGADGDPVDLEGSDAPHPAGADTSAGGDR